MSTPSLTLFAKHHPYIHHNHPYSPPSFIFWLVSHLEICATSSSPPTHNHHQSSPASFQLRPSSHISNISHRMSRQCNSSHSEPRSILVTLSHQDPSQQHLTLHHNSNSCTTLILSPLHLTHSSLSPINDISGHTFKTHRTSCMTV